MPDNETCSECRCYLSMGKSWGMCRRYPPVYVGLPGADEEIDRWDMPSVYSTGWCGEFRRK